MLPEAQGARLQAGPLLVQRQGRPLRGLPGRRRDRHRDALPARRLRDVRAVQGPPLQPRDAGDQVPRQVDRRRARAHGRSGAAAARELPADRQQAAHAAGRRPRLHRARPVGDDAVGRRGAAGQAGARSCRGAAPAARSTSSTSRRPACTSRTRASCSTCSTSWSTRATRSWSSSTTSTSSSRPTTSSTSGPRAARAAAGLSRKALPRKWREAEKAATGRFLAESGRRRARAHWRRSILTRTVVD